MVNMLPLPHLLKMTFLHSQRFFCIALTVCVTRWWVGRENASLAEPTSSHETCLKTRRLPPVGCTLCWAAFITHTFETDFLLAKTIYLFLLCVGQCVANYIFVTLLVLARLFVLLCKQPAHDRYFGRLDFARHKLAPHAHY